MELQTESPNQNRSDGRVDTRETTRIRALTGIRFFAAMHIFWFHLNAINSIPELPEQVRYSVFQSWPSWFLNVVEHGYCSTSFFYILSGFILAYLYIDGEGKFNAPAKSFWVARFARIYPLHIVAMLLSVPMALGMVPPSPSICGYPVDRLSFLVASGIANLLLVQAWIPEFSMTWNIPTWSLSAIVFAYLLFPFLVRVIGAMKKRNYWLLAGLLIFAGLLPSLLHDLVIGREVPMSIASEFVMRFPPFWLPHFLSGVWLAVHFGFSRDLRESQKHSSPRAFVVSFGDLAIAALMAIYSIDDAWLDSLFGPNHSVHFLLRHGLLTPLFLVVIFDLASGRGLAAKMLGWKFWEFLGQASFTIFMLQMLGSIGGIIFSSITGENGWGKLIVATISTISISLASVAWFEKPVAKQIRRLWIRNSPQ